MPTEKSITIEPLIEHKIKEYLDEIMEKARLPGLAVAVENNGERYLFTNGVINVKSKTRVTTRTCFEIGSMTKAFTALAILLLDNECKLSLNDSIDKYLPNYFASDDSTNYKILISDLLYHRSGIPAYCIGRIGRSDSYNAIAKAVEQISGCGLNFVPGTLSEYSTVNYVLLGRIIEHVSGSSYEDFITEKILNPLGLHNTKPLNYNDKTLNMADGHKAGIMQNRPCGSPKYRGIMPAGYLVTDIEDMSRWIGIQCGVIEAPSSLRNIIEISHKADLKMEPIGKFFFAAGWSSNVRQTLLMHGGTNPTFSSMIIIDKKRKQGVCVLTNINTNLAYYIAKNILRLVNGKETISFPSHKFYEKRREFFSLFVISNIIIMFLSFWGVYMFSLKYIYSFLLVGCILSVAIFFLAKAIIGKQYPRIKWTAFFAWAPFFLIQILLGVSLLLSVILGWLICLYFG